MIRAEIDSLEGSLRANQLRIEDGFPLMMRAHMAYRREGDSWSTAASLLQMAKACSRIEALSRSRELAREADRHLAECDDPFLHRVAAHVRCDWLTRSGRLEEAMEELRRGQETGYDSEVMALRTECLIAEIVCLGGSLEAAEDKFLSVRSSFMTRGLRFEASEAGVDLARIYYQQGRRKDGLALLDFADSTYSQLGVSAGLGEIDDLRARFRGL